MASFVDKYEDILLKNMCLIIANSNVTVKSQQKDEPDLTVEQKVVILIHIARQNPGSFLARFGRLLSSEHLSYFEKLQKDDYEVEFRLKELWKLLNDKTRHVKIQNRRYEALKRLSKDTDYFEENEMRKRDPLLYEQYIGQYLTDEECIAINKADQSSDPTLSGFLMQRYDCQQTALRFQYQQEREEEICEEEDNEDEDDDEENGEDCETSSPIKGVPNDTEKQLLRDEFLSIMQANFLSGKDSDFDYTKVDTSDEYDDLKLRERDEEEAYFDYD